MRSEIVDRKLGDTLTEKIIGCAIAVHRELGPGLLEGIYRDALCVEFADADLAYERERPIPILYKNRLIGEYRADIIVDDKVVLELKAVSKDDPVYFAQLLSYLKILDKRQGLLINFHRPTLREGIRRIVN
jgi:GxxExxY protein